MEPVLSLQNIGFCYGQQPALTGIDLRLKDGEILGIIGPNGSGKSTLLKIMGGLLAPTDGDIRLHGRPLRALHRPELAREIAMVAQENYFRFAFTALEVVLMGRYPHLKRLQFEGRKDIDAAMHALDATQAADLADRPIHELSGGERQRVLIARALAQEPRIMLLDEPTSFLDLKFKREIFRLIAALSRDTGLTVALVSHDIDLTAMYCSRLVMLKQGGIYTAGMPHDVVTADHIGAVYECPVLVDINPATGRPRTSIV
jgi:iron complex transport system ATP-binding protein